MLFEGTNPNFGEGPMKYLNRLGFGVAAIATAAVTLCPTSMAQNASSDNDSYYVANTRPPDAFLALRTNPTSGSGQRIATMPNGTPLKVLERRGDGWWYVRVLPSGPEGWALSRQGNSVWIVCCATGGGAQRQATIPPQLPGSELVESYTAFLSEADHFNSQGQRLTSAAAIIRQDRANFHLFGRGDPQDEGDSFFADEGKRQALETMLDRGKAAPGVISRIVNGTATIHVDIYRGASGPFIRVSVLN
jgi:Bacterial SH3 domain